MQLEAGWEGAQHTDIELHRLNLRAMDDCDHWRMRNRLSSQESDINGWF